MYSYFFREGSKIFFRILLVFILKLLIRIFNRWQWLGWNLGISDYESSTLNIRRSWGASKISPFVTTAPRDQASSHSSNKTILVFKKSIPVSARSKAWTGFARSHTGIVGSNPTQSMNSLRPLPHWDPGFQSHSSHDPSSTAPTPGIWVPNPLKPWTIFDRSHSGIVASNPTQSMNSLRPLPHWDRRFQSHSKHEQSTPAPTLGS
jgi:hypothetical protein